MSDLKSLLPTDIAEAVAASSNYYKVNYHKAHCRICSFPQNEVEQINKLILDGTSNDIITTYICQELHPLEDYDPNIMKKTVQLHADYLPYLISDVQLKGIFANARNIVQGENFNTLDSMEKAKQITAIERKLIEEIEDMKDAQLSIYNCLFKETLPLILNRLTMEILNGKAVDIKHIAMSSDIILRISAALNISKDISSEVIEEHSNDDDKQNIINLADRIKNAMDNVGGNNE
jgi:hypothetical protein